MEITDLSPLQWGSAKLGYSPFILSSFIEVVFDDPAGLVRDTFNALFEELDYPVVITGPNFLWRGMVRRGLVGRPVAVRVHRQQTSLFIYDRLAALKELPGISTVDLIFCRAVAAAPCANKLARPAPLCKTLLRDSIGNLQV